MSVPWWALSPSPMTLFYYAVLSFYGAYKLGSNSLRQWISNFAESAFVVLLVIMVFDSVWQVLQWLKWGYIYPQEIVTVRNTLIRNTLVFSLCALSSWKLNEKTNVLNLQKLVLIVFPITPLTARFLIVSEPTWTDWTYGLRFENNSPWLLSYLTGLIDKASLAVVYLGLWKKKVNQFEANKVGQTTTKHVTVIIPSLDEPYLPKLLVNLADYHVNVRTEKGLCNAVYHGIQNCKTEIVCVMDADGSHPPEAIPHMLKLLDKDVWLVIGSRYCSGGYSFDLFHRKFWSLLYCLITRIVLRTKIRDPMSGFWVGYKSAFDFSPSDNYKFGIELIRKNKSHISEFPIIFQKRKSGTSHIKPVQAIKDLLVILKVS